MEDNKLREEGRGGEERKGTREEERWRSLSVTNSYERYLMVPPSLYVVTFQPYVTRAAESTRGK